MDLKEISVAWSEEIPESTRFRKTESGIAGDDTMFRQAKQVLQAFRGRSILNRSGGLC